jgi:hypothetical protein
MRGLVLTVGLLLLLGMLAGCGTSADRLVREQIGLLEELADAYENGAPQSKIDEIKKEMVENDKKLEELKLSEDAKRKALLPYKDAMDRANQRIEAARKRAEQAGKR